MQWILPPMERKALPAFPAWWGWIILPLACVAVAGVILLFTWPVERGFASLRFGFWLLAAPLLAAGVLGLFWLSHLLQLKREIAWRHLFLDRKQVQWKVLGRRTLKLAAWHLVTPEPELMSRILGMSGTPPEAPSVTLRLPVEGGCRLGESPLHPLFISLLGPLQPALNTLPVVDIWLSAAGQSEDNCRQALTQGWLSLLNRQLPASRIHWLEQPADAALFDRWCDEPSDIPRLVLCLHQIQDDAKAMEFSAALLFMPHNQCLPERLPFRPVYVFRPLLTPASAPEKKFTALLDVQQIPPGHRRHLWDAGLDARARNTLLSTLDITGDALPADGQHLLPTLVGDQGRAGFFLALSLAAAATDTGQQGQMVVAPLKDNIASVQLSIRPADRVPEPEDRVSRYPLAWLGASACLLTLFGLLPSPSLRLALWPWLLAGFTLYALLLAFPIPLALKLWRFRLEDEWQTSQARIPMSKMASLFWLLVALLLLALCHVKAPVWFTEPATVWIVQAGILLAWLLVIRFGFAVRLIAWLRPTDKKEEDAERVFGPLCDRHSTSFWQPRKKPLPWLLVTGQVAHVEALMPGLITERWQVSYRGIFLWCGEPGQIADADIVWLKRRLGRRGLNAVLWITDVGDTDSCAEITQRTLWQQLRRTGALLGWRLPMYAVVRRGDEHEQYDRPRQSAGVCWAPGVPAEIAAQLDVLVSGLVAKGMVQVQHNRRWSWLLQLAQDIRQAALSPLAVALQPLANAQSGVLLSGMFIMPLALPGQHAGYREVSVSPAWYEVLRQAQIRRGKRDHLVFRDWLYRGVLVVTGLWCTGMLVSAFYNTRLIHDNKTLLAPDAAGASMAEQLRHQRELQCQTDMLLWRSREGSPVQFRFGLDQNQRQLSRLWPAWQRQNQRLMLAPLMAQLTTQLRQYVDLPAGSPARHSLAGATYQYLKAYLMLTQPKLAEPAFLKQTLAPLWHTPDARILPGEWLMLSSDMLDFYSRELPHHPGWRQPADTQLIASVRTLLRSQKGLRNSENALYQSVLQQAEKQRMAIALSDLLADSAAGGLLFTAETLPGIFTREAWEQDVRGLIAKVSASRQVMADWVLDDGKVAASKALSEETLRKRLTARYFTDYASAWLAFLNSVHWQQATTLSDTIDQLSELGDSQRSPLIVLGNVLRWQAGVGQEGRTMGESLLNSAKQLVSGDKIPEGQQTVIGGVRAENKPADVVAQTFAPLLSILPAEEGQKNSASPPGGLTLQDYLLQVTQVRLLLQQTSASNDPQGGMLALMQEGLNSKGSVLSTARRRGALLAASLGQDWNGFATAVFSEPPDQAWQSVLEPAGQALNDAWRQRVVNGWRAAFSERYPFAATASDASLPLLAHFITPQSGVVEQFISQQLHGLVEKQGDEWVPVAAMQQAMAINPAFLAAINLLSRTGYQAFAQGEATLRFAVQMRPQRNIMEINLQLDDTALKYFNQQAEWQSFSWPDKQTAHPRAVLSYIPLNDNGNAALPPVTALSFNGPWAVIRLLDNARSEQLDSSRWRMTWVDKNGQPLSLILRAESYAGPLGLLKLRGFKLPATVFTPATGGNDAQ